MRRQVHGWGLQVGVGGRVGDSKMRLDWQTRSGGEHKGEENFFFFLEESDHRGTGGRELDDERNGWVETNRGVGEEELTG